MGAAVTRSVLVTIQSDEKLSRRFMDWLITEGITPIPSAGGWSGQGGYQGTFHARHADRIEKFIIDNEGRPD